MLYPSIGQYTEAIKLAAGAPEDYHINSYNG